MTTSLSAPAPRAACSPTASRPTGRARAADRGGRPRRLHWIHIPVGYLYCIGNPRTDWLYTPSPIPASTAAASLSARQGAGRLLQHQRHDLHARPGARLRRLGAQTRRRRLELGRRAAVLHAARGPHRGAEPDAFDDGAPAANGASRSSACAGTSSTPSRRRPSKPASRAATTSTAATTRASATSRSTRGAAFAGTRPRPSCGRCSHRPNLQSDRRAWSSALRARRQRRCTRRALSRRDGAPRTRRRATREVDAGGRRIGSPQILQLSGIGAGALLQQHGIDVVHDAARRRREPAGPPADPRGVQGQGVRTLNTLRAALVRQGADRPASTRCGAAAR